MPTQRQYHNLRGLVRDIERALREGDYSEVFAFLDLVEDIEDARDGIESDTVLEDAEDTATDVGDPQLELRNSDDGSSLLAAPSGHGSGRDPLLGGSPGLGSPVERQEHAGELARAAIARPAHALDGTSLDAVREVPRGKN